MSCFDTFWISEFGGNDINVVEFALAGFFSPTGGHRFGK